MTYPSADLIGQSLLLSFEGPELTPEIGAALVRVRPAGVILFAKNIITPAGLYQLCADLQRSAAQLGLPPMLIAIDQEGGVVSVTDEPDETNEPASRMKQRSDSLADNQAISLVAIARLRSPIAVRAQSCVTHCYGRKSAWGSTISG
jgi:beta-glucosidase-like glycosyl hydrolase